MPARRADRVPGSPADRQVHGIGGPRDDRPAVGAKRHDLEQRSIDAQRSLVDVEDGLLRGEAEHFVPRTAAHVAIDVTPYAGPRRDCGHGHASKPSDVMRNITPPRSSDPALPFPVRFECAFLKQPECVFQDPRITCLELKAEKDHRRALRRKSAG